MLLDECFCSYHSLQQQHNNLTQKLQHLEVHNRCQQQELINGNYHHQHQNVTPLPNGGKKRNFSSVDDNGDVDMECQGARCNTMNQQRKRAKSNEVQVNGNANFSRMAQSQNQNQQQMQVAEKSLISTKPCVRCMNGEPGHINHIMNQEVEMEE
ncbi:uncharacterized protein [Clytia hemisphaerica]|uniref:Uncharacterized protein n=1 Tax=Clytia hemisphaerica TaxID=252671 RepID=A0A7M5X5I3_9CNID|eukprot:TCONS_00056775-protein